MPAHIALKIEKSRDFAGIWYLTIDEYNSILPDARVHWETTDGSVKIWSHNHHGKGKPEWAMWCDHWVYCISLKREDGRDSTLLVTPNNYMVSAYYGYSHFADVHKKDGQAIAKAVKEFNKVMKNAVPTLVCPSVSTNKEAFAATREKYGRMLDQLD